MKKSLLLPPLLLSALFAGAQSLKLSDLIYMTPMDNNAVYATLKSGDVFKQDYSENVNGYPMEYFRKKDASNPNEERIASGMYTRLYDGTVLRTLDYSSTNVQYILNMVSQAKYFEGMQLVFQGADETNNIYLFNSNYYQVSIYVRRDQASGLVEIKQKDFVDVD